MLQGQLPDPYIAQSSSLLLLPDLQSHNIDQYNDFLAFSGQCHYFL